MPIDWDSVKPDEPTGDLKTLQEAAQEVCDLEEMRDELEAQVDDIKKRLRHLTDDFIPQIMKAIGLSDFTLEDGSKITIKDSVSGTINRAPDFNWAKSYVIDKGGKDLIKTEVKTLFSCGAHNEALSFVAELNERGYEAQATETIHPQTFASFGRELLKDYQEALDKGQFSEPPPFKELGLYHARSAKITKKKK